MANILKNDGFRTGKNLPDATIPPSTVFTGDIDTAGGVRIDGTVKGKVSAGGDITIGLDGVIEGSARACNVNVAGKVTGDVIATGAVKMLAGSKIVGDLAATCFAIEKGAHYKGKCMITDSNEQPMLSAPKSEETESKADRSKAPESEVPESKAPESEVPESEAVESEVPESEAVESEAVETATKQEEAKKQNAAKTSAKQNKYRKR